MFLLLAGTRRLTGSEIGFAWGGAADGIRGQLSDTVPDALLVALCVAVNLLAGAVLVRWLRGVPYGSWRAAALHGLVGAVVLDVAMLGLLGSIGWFRFAPVAIVHLAILFAGWRRAAPLALPGRDRKSHVPGVLWVVVAAIWSAPLLVQLASPVVAFPDVLPNHIAPAEHARAFGSFTWLTTNPSAVYGPSRLFLGYVATLGTVSVLGGLPAIVAAAAIVAPLTFLLALACYEFAEAEFGRGAGWFALLAVPLTFVFLRLPDARGVTLAASVGLLALRDHRDVPFSRRQVVLALALGAAAMLHPLTGFLAFAAKFVRSLLDRDEPFDLPALAGGAVVATPQLLAMLGVRTSAVALAAGVAGGGALARAAAGVRIPRPDVSGALVAVGAGVLLAAPVVLDRFSGPLIDPLRAYPLLSLGTLLALVFAASRRPVSLTIAPALAVGVAVAGLVSFLPTSLEWKAFHDELAPSALRYWLPLFLALAAGGGLAAAWRAADAKRPTHLLVVVWLGAAVLPLHAGMRNVGIDNNVEHRWSETLAVSLHRAQFGAWERYPDPRRIVDAGRLALVERVRGEQRAGRIDPRTHLLHIAASFRPWVATPLAAFTGVVETVFSLDPERSEHTLGGRLRHVRDLDRYLGPRHLYVALEPAGLSEDVRRQILDAGYSLTFRNDQAQLFRYRGSATER